MYFVHLQHFFLKYIQKQVLLITASNVYVIFCIQQYKTLSISGKLNPQYEPFCIYITLYMMQNEVVAPDGSLLSLQVRE